MINAVEIIAHEYDSNLGMAVVVAYLSTLLKMILHR